jgi:glutaredoxin 3
MNIEAYFLIGCGHCNTLRKLFERADVEYTAHYVRETISMQDFKQKYPDISNFPFVVIDGKRIGGLVETAKLFIDKGLVSSKK